MDENEKHIVHMDTMSHNYDPTIPTCDELISPQAIVFALGLKCALPEDTIDVDLKVYTLKGIHMFRKDYKS